MPQIKPLCLFALVAASVLLAGCTIPYQASGIQAVQPPTPASTADTNAISLVLEQPPPTPAPIPAAAPVDVEIGQLQASGTCASGFIAHTLEHITTTPGGDVVEMFEANGSGLAVNDLDNDGDVDIVLGNYAGPNSILWNQGSMQFEMESMSVGDTRAVSIVDVDGDGWQDIILSRTISAPNFWHNQGDGTFVQSYFNGMDKPLYAMNWADLDGDNDLDLVGGTYDAALLTALGYEFLSSSKAGVYLYENDGGRFMPSMLAANAHALTIALVDLNHDKRADILVGNDFDLPDYSWLRTDEGWLPHSMDTMSHSTMSIDFGDIDNNGIDEIFTTDMMPYDESPSTLEVWQPVMDDMMEPELPDEDPQIMSNMLLIQTGVAGYQNAARARGVDATGWSWSSKFGDLDQDGFLDLLVVNGFIAKNTFPELPRHELVEENQAFRNRGDGYFDPAPAWGLASNLSGRAMSMADFDLDGDLDIIVNNLRGPAQLFENQLCSGSSLQVDLFWPDSANTRALGARLTLHTDKGSFYRQVKATSGYLSGDPARVHFGFPDDAVLNSIDIVWPDGKVSSLAQPQPGSIMSITRKH